MKQAMKDIPRVVWLLAASMFIVAALSFAMVYLFVYLTGPSSPACSSAASAWPCCPRFPQPP